jgi:hypothetical protein
VSLKYVQSNAVLRKFMFPRGKARPGRDADRSPPSSAEVKDE